MTTYNFSSNPNVVFDRLNDRLFVDNTSAASLRIFQSGANVVLASSTNSATLQNFNLEQFSSPSNIQFADGSVLLIGDNTTGTINDSAPNPLTGGSGNDQIWGRDNADTLDGGAGSDLIYGNQGGDIVRGSSGNDTAFGGKGNDSIDYFSFTGNTLIFGNREDDQLFGGSGHDTIYGGQGNDSINGSHGTNLLEGNLGDDTIFGGDGNDFIRGGEGRDQISAGFGRNTIYGNQDDDLIGGAIGTKPIYSVDTIYGGQGNDTILYQNSNDEAAMYGNEANDTLRGGAGADSIYGGKGDDVIRGGTGGDLLQGGLGIDTFVMVARTGGAAGDETGMNSPTPDFVADFVTAIDKLQMTLDGVSTPGDANIYSEYIDTNVTTSAEARASYTGRLLFDKYVFIAGDEDGFLIIDTDVNGSVDGLIRLLDCNLLSDLNHTDII